MYTPLDSLVYDSTERTTYRSEEVSAMSMTVHAGRTPVNDSEWQAELREQPVCQICYAYAYSQLELQLNTREDLYPPSTPGIEPRTGLFEDMCQCRSLV